MLLLYIGCLAAHLQSCSSSCSRAAPPSVKNHPPAAAVPPSNDACLCTCFQVQPSMNAREGLIFGVLGLLQGQEWSGGRRLIATAAAKVGGIGEGEEI